jgi:hypothetical protein
VKRSVLLPTALLLSACSTNSQLNVVDGLTLVAANDGVGMNPSRWIVSGHPVQTTYVSLNGQLGLKAGQVCIASRFRSPFTNNCQNIDTVSPKKNEGISFYSEYYQPEEKDNKSTLKDLLNTIYEVREAQIDYVSKSSAYYACVAQKKVEFSKNERLLDENKAITETKKQLPELCSDEKGSREQALSKLKSKQLAERKQTMQPNRLIYNWAESLKFEGGAVVLEQSNTVGSGSYNNEASGYTIVNGILIERFQIDCAGIDNLIKRHTDHDRLKIVTMTLSADELYYDASEDKAATFNANLTFSPSELKTLKNIFDSDIETDINAALASSYNIASSGYLTLGAKAKTSSNSSNNKGLTYYAVLTDLKSFQCSK